MGTPPGFDIRKLFQEAQSRWLKPPEVFYILQNYEECGLTQKPPSYPPSGSLLLFNRRVLRRFRNDGYSWRKKKDGRTVGEAHERLKVGNIDALNCYYAHGEKNPTFQRRCYWMLDPAWDHIVLVHYREITEGRLNEGSSSHLSPESFSNASMSAEYYNTQNCGPSSAITDVYEPYQGIYSPCSVEEVSSEFVVRNNEVDHVVGNETDRLGENGLSSPRDVNQVLQRLTKELSLGNDDALAHLEKLHSDCKRNENSHDLSIFGYENGLMKQGASVFQPLGPHCAEYNQWLNRNAGIPYEPMGLLEQNSGDAGKLNIQFESSTVDMKGYPSWKEMLDLSSSTKNTSNTFTSRKMFELDHQTNEAAPLGNTFVSISESDRIREFLTMQRLQHEKLESKGPDLKENGNNCHQISKNSLSSHRSTAGHLLFGSDDPIMSPSSSELHESVSADSVMTMKENKSSLDWTESQNMRIEKYHHDNYEGWYGQQSHLETTFEPASSLTIAQKQCFSIREISPEWAYSGEGTKLIITGDFLCNPSECAWGCMFGDIEVQAEVIQAGVLRCQTPENLPGKVDLCITAGNRESCSEIREFEFRIKPESSTLDRNLPEKDAYESLEELLLLARFAEILLIGHDSSTQRENSNDLEFRNLSNSKQTDPWSQINEALLVGSEDPSSVMKYILQELLKDKLQQWLSSKCHDTEAYLTKEEQGVIHMIAGLGYEWALNSILNAGIGINFRDVNGWTALHWAARFGREKMVAALLAAGAFAGAVTDPTPQEPVGKTPASLASSHGHKGLAGYLSEAALTSHLSSLTLEESEISKGSAAVEAEKIVEGVTVKSIHLNNDATEDQLSLQDSLAAVRNAAQAAARIQSAFRAHSFRRRRSSACRDEYGLTANDIHGLSAASKTHFLRDYKLNTAALSIQKKYRGWKRRKEFLNLRQNVVKIQAHVRGHQVRKKYREFLWTVGVLEKVILRWRRKGVGLRGFRAVPDSISENEDDILKVFRKQKVDAALDEALSRVLSVVDSPTARQQYRRLLENYRNAKAEVANKHIEASSSQEIDNMEDKNDDDVYYLKF